MNPGQKGRDRGVRSVLFYSDAAEYGGHEAMTVEAVQSLCGRSDLALSFASYAGNKRLSAHLEGMKRESRNLQLIPFQFHSKSLQAFRSLISWRKIEQIQSLMKQQQPDVVVVSQGRIESGSLGLLAAKRAGYFTISYLPVAHSVSVSGKPFGVRIREMINKHFYRLPDRIITISESARRMLRERGVASDVVVVPNAIQSRPIEQLDRQRFRVTHGVPDCAYLVATIGRIQFRHKGQDFAIKAIARRRHELKGYSFAFIGDGPDANRLREMISALDLSRQVKILPWTPDPAEVYAAIDMLLIPSRFEGVPLVMLEAMSYKLPIVASDSDGMAEMLPREWLFPFGNYQALADRLLFVRNAEKSRLLDLHYTQVTEGFSPAKFRERVSAAILE